MIQLNTPQAAVRDFAIGDEIDRDGDAGMTVAAGQTKEAGYFDTLVKHEEWRLVVRRGLIGAIAALAVSSGVAQAAGGGGLPGRVYESGQPNPHWSETDKDSAADPVAWLQRVFQRGLPQEANRTADQSESRTPPRLR